MSFAMNAGPKEQKLLFQLGSPHESLVRSQPCVQSKSFSPTPHGVSAPHHTLVLQVCTPVRLPLGGMGSVGLLFPACVTQR